MPCRMRPRYRPRRNRSRAQLSRRSRQRCLRRPARMCGRSCYDWLCYFRADPGSATKLRGVCSRGPAMMLRMFFRVGLAEMAVTDDDFHKSLATISASSDHSLLALDAAIRGRLGVGIEPLAAVEAACELCTHCASMADIEARRGEAIVPALPAERSQSGALLTPQALSLKTCKVTFNA